jgi:hypothetical protein
MLQPPPGIESPGKATLFSFLNALENCEAITNDNGISLRPEVSRRAPKRICAERVPQTRPDDLLKASCPHVGNVNAIQTSMSMACKDFRLDHEML